MALGEEVPGATTLQRDRAHVSADGLTTPGDLMVISMLQRDRAHVSADGRRGKLPVSVSFWLQRDRAHVSADGVLQIAQVTAPGLASTGPRSRERGWQVGHMKEVLRISCFNGTALT